jgi:hypothetical protein
MNHRLLALATVSLALLGPRVAHADAPAVVPIQGILSDSEGAPLDGNVAVTLALYDAPTDGAVLHTETMTLSVDRGFFTAYLGTLNAIDLALFRDVGTIYLGITVGGDPEMTPRLEVGTVPFAAFAQHAGDARTLQGLTPDDFASDWSDITGIPADIADGDDDTTYSAGTGLDLAGTVFSANQATIEAWARGVCFDTAAEVEAAIGPHFTSADAVAAMGAKGSTNPLHHDRYANAEAIAAMGAKAITNALHHDRYTNAEAVAAMGAKGAGNPLHHDRYANAEAIAAMGAKGAANPLHHDRYTDAEATAAAANATGNLTVCPTGYTSPAPNLCISGWRLGATFNNAQADCFAEAAHVCTYAEFHYMWNQGGTNPGFITGDWIGNVVDDDEVLCVNSTTNASNFEGTCDKGGTRDYRCCKGNGR